MLIANAWGRVNLTWIFIALFNSTQHFTFTATPSGGAADMPGVQIFSDKKFFILQRVPSRSSFIDIIERNGGRVVKIEQQADYTIADHLRKDAPYGSLSYKFIEDAVRSGEIPTEDKYRNGTSTSGPSPRAVGGLSQPVKGTRTPFSAEDDQVLYQWVADYGSRGGSVRGNEIYKELERKVRFPLSVR